MKTKEEIFKLIMSEPDESALIVKLSEQIDQQFKRIEKLEEALRNLLEFAHEYGPSTRAGYEDWSGYFIDAEKALLQ